jgi:hypothetical protein
VLWVAFTISSLWTTATMYQSPGRKYLIHYGLLFSHIVVALNLLQLKRIKDGHFMVRQTFGTSICRLMWNRWALISTALTTDPPIRKQCHEAIAAPAPFLPRISSHAAPLLPQSSKLRPWSTIAHAIAWCLRLRVESRNLIVRSMYFYYKMLVIP